MDMSHSQESFTALSPAKINPYLRVVSRRSDGFHNIEAIFLAIDLFDELQFDPSDELEFSAEGSAQLPTGPDNLVFRAAELLRKEAGISQGARIHLRKNIPMGAGMGGGSSNAATVLQVLNRLWDIRFPIEKLVQIGLAIGSDVPFFLREWTAAIGEGRGEKLREIPDFAEKRLVLVQPGVSVSTRWAYEQITKLLTGPRQNVNLVKLYQDYLQGRIPLSQLLYNDFEEVVFSQYPELASIKQQLIDAGAEGAVMTGSGSTMVGFFNDPKGLHDRIRSLSRYSAVFASPLRNPTRCF